MGPIGKVSLRWLPAPDVLEFALPDNHVFLIVDDGTDLVPPLVDRCRAMMWPIVVIRPSQLAPTRAAADLPSEVAVVPLAEATEGAVVAALETVRETWGPVAGCAVLCTSGQPQGAGLGSKTGPNCEGGEAEGILASLADRRWLRLSFLFAKHLEGSLSAAARQGWGGFLTVTRIDGALGFTGATDCLPAAAGLTGLVKTLQQEWPAVRCRAIDLAPAMAPAVAAEAVLDEILDPNSEITEVGRSPSNRVTLVAQETGALEEMTDGG